MLNVFLSCSLTCEIFLQRTLCFLSTGLLSLTAWCLTILLLSRPIRLRSDRAVSVTFQNKFGFIRAEIGLLWPHPHPIALSFAFFSPPSSSISATFLLKCPNFFVSIETCFSSYLFPPFYFFLKFLHNPHFLHTVWFPRGMVSSKINGIIRITHC